MADLDLIRELGVLRRKIEKIESDMVRPTALPPSGTAGGTLTGTYPNPGLATPGSLTVATTNSAAAPHTHAITTSSNPGAAASILASDSAGGLTLVTETVSGRKNRGAGTSFPASPATGDEFFRSDRGLLYFYDGTRWLTVNEYDCGFTPFNAVQPNAVTAAFMQVPVDPDYDMYIVQVAWRANLGVNNSTNYWSLKLEQQSAAGTVTDVWNVPDTTKALAAGLNRGSAAPNIVVAKTQHVIYWTKTITGAPGATSFAIRMKYRLVG